MLNFVDISCLLSFCQKLYWIKMTANEVFYFFLNIFKLSRKCLFDWNEPDSLTASIDNKQQQNCNYAVLQLVIDRYSTKCFVLMNLNDPMHFPNNFPQIQIFSNCTFNSCGSFSAFFFLLVIQTTVYLYDPLVAWNIHAVSVVFELGYFKDQLNDINFLNRNIYKPEIWEKKEE